MPPYKSGAANDGPGAIPIIDPHFNERWRGCRYDETHCCAYGRRPDIGHDGVIGISGVICVVEIIWHSHSN